MTERGSVYPDQLAFNIRKLVGRHADAIIANSAQGSQLWERLAPDTPVQWIPNMVIDDDLCPRTPVDRTGSVECLAVGRLEPEKNIGDMVAAFSTFAATCREYCRRSTRNVPKTISISSRNTLKPTMRSAMSYLM